MATASAAGGQAPPFTVLQASRMARSVEHVREQLHVAQQATSDALQQARSAEEVRAGACAGWQDESVVEIVAALTAWTRFEHGKGTSRFACSTSPHTHATLHRSAAVWRAPQRLLGSGHAQSAINC